MTIEQIVEALLARGDAPWEVAERLGLSAEICGVTQLPCSHCAGPGPCGSRRTWYETTNDLEKTKTCDLVAEISKRDGVEKHTAEPYEDVTVSVNGPAVVLVVTD